MFRKWADFLWPIGATVLALLVMPLAIEQYPKFFKENRWPLPLSVVVVLICWVFPFFLHDRAKKTFAWMGGQGWAVKSVMTILLFSISIGIMWASWKLFQFHSAHLEAALRKKEVPKEQHSDDQSKKEPLLVSGLRRIGFPFLYCISILNCGGSHVGP